MDKNQIWALFKDKYSSIEELIKACQKSYDEGKPILSDAEFDILTQDESQVELAESGNHKFQFPMGSLNQVQPGDLDNWIKDKTYVATTKLDGCSVVVEIKNNKSIRWLTRGNGIEGKIIDPNKLWQYNFQYESWYRYFKPGTQLTGFIRGELIFPKDSFIKFQNEQAKKGKIFKNARNTVAGYLNAINSVNPEEYKPYLHFIAFELFDGDIERDYLSDLYKLKELGFEVPDYGLYPMKMDGFRGNENHFIKSIKINNQYYNYECDGLVFRENHYNIGEFSGSSINPKSAIKYKLKGINGKQTKIVGVDWEVGLGGRLNPTAIIQPIQLSGATVSRVTLNSYDFCKNLCLGDLVEVERSGDVIPKLLKIIESNGGQPLIDLIPQQYKPYSIVGRHAYTQRETTGEKVKLFQHFLTSLGLDKIGIGPGKLEDAVKAKITPQMIFEESPQYTEMLCKGFGKYHYQILNGISKNRYTSLLASLRVFGDLSARRTQELYSLVKGDFVNADRSIVHKFLGPVAYERYEDDVKKLPYYEEIAKRLKLDMSYDDNKKTVVFSGFREASDGPITTKLKSEGYRVVDNLTSKTSLLVCKKGEQTGKYKQALKYKIEIRFMEDM